MRRKLKILLVIFSVSLNVAIFAVWLWHSMLVWLGGGWPWESKGADTDEAIWCPLHRQLGLSRKQWNRIEPCLLRCRAKAQYLRKKMEALRLNMVDLIAASQVDRRAVDAKREEIHAAQAMMQELVIGHLIAEKELLAPGQQKILFDMIRSRCSGAYPGTHRAE